MSAVLPTAETSARAWVDLHELPGGERFRLRGWRSASPTKTALVVHHGLGEHGGRYETFARHLADEPFHVVTYDLRGHGESSGRRGDVAGLDGLAADLELLLPVLIERTGVERVLLCGHSMGAAGVGWYLASRRPHPAITAILLSAAPVVIAKTPSMRAKAFAARLLSRIAPSLALGNEIAVDAISSDPAEVERYRSDPLVHDRISVRLGLSLLRDAPALVERARAITLPALLWHGSDDPLVDVGGTRALHDALGSADKTFHELAGYRHEAHHETPERVARLFALIREWIRPRIAR